MFCSFDEHIVKWSWKFTSFFFFLITYALITDHDEPIIKHGKHNIVNNVLV